MWSFLIFFLLDIILKLNIAIIKKGNVIYIFEYKDYQRKKKYNEKIFTDILYFRFILSFFSLLYRKLRKHINFYFILCYQLNQTLKSNQ